MSVTITVRDVPDDVRDELAARAARAGKSLQEYLRGMFVDTAARLPVEDVIARARHRNRGAGRCPVDTCDAGRRPAVSVRAVCDASAVVALLLDAGPDGQWVAQALAGAALAAPALVMFEASNILRRHELAGLVSADQSALAHGDLLDLAIEYWPYELLASRVWELRRNLSGYDASYVAVAELTGAPLVTLDRRIGRAPNLRCAVATP